MIIRKTERLYIERTKKWFKHGSFDKELITVVVRRKTIWVLFIPIFWTESIESSN